MLLCMCVYISVIKDESDCTAINDCPTPSWSMRPIGRFKAGKNRFFRKRTVKKEPPFFVDLFASEKNSSRRMQRT